MLNDFLFLLGDEEFCSGSETYQVLQKFFRISTILMVEKAEREGGKSLVR